MKKMTKEEFKQELIDLKKQLDIIEEAAEELMKEDSEAAEFLRSATKSDLVSAIVVAKFVEIVASFLKVERPEIGTNKLIKK